MEEERLKLLLDNAIICLKEWGYNFRHLKTSIGITKEEYKGTITKERLEELLHNALLCLKELGYGPKELKISIGIEEGEIVK